MGVMDQLAGSLGRKGDAPNIEPAERICRENDATAVPELVKAPGDADQRVRGDCTKAICEVGYRKPELISPYAEVFIDLLNDKNNRIAWGGMIALMGAAPLNPVPIHGKPEVVLKAFERGSVITKDAGVGVIADAQGFAR